LRYYIHCILIVSAILILAGCATTPPLQPVADPQQAWLQIQSHLRQLQSWQIEGRIGVETPQQSLSADALWVQQQNRYHMTFSGALGLGTVTLSNQSGNIVLVNAKGKRFVADSAPALMQQQLGWYVPVAGLYYWVRGLPIPGVALQRHLNQYGTLQSLDQQGWHIVYNNYRDQQGFVLPGRLIMTRDKLRVVLLINRWVVK
jgi:outer membrane lipoprotein LolB